MAADRVADHNADRFSSDGLTTLFRTLQRELDDDYFETLNGHLRKLRFRNDELMSAQLDRDNSGINYVLRSGMPGTAGKSASDRAPVDLLLRDPAPRRSRIPGTVGHDQPGNPPGSQRRSPLSRPRHQLLHHAPGRARVLCQLPQPERSAHGQGPAGDIPRAVGMEPIGTVLRGPPRRQPGPAKSIALSATTWTPTASQRSCAAPAWPS